jgi:hypothetical protein
MEKPLETSRAIYCGRFSYRSVPGYLGLIATGGLGFGAFSAAIHSDGGRVVLLAFGAVFALVFVFVVLGIVFDFDKGLRSKSVG